MSSRTVEQALAWAATGNAMISRAAADLSDENLRAPSSLPGWSVAHVLAHVAANGDALLNLVTWARTGVPTPMYASAQERAEGIARGDVLTPAQIRSWLEGSAERLAAGFDSLSAHEWATEVTTAQGRTVPATELPYMRSRECLVHVVDLARGLTFSDLPDDFIEALIEDICAKRGLTTEALPIGPRPEIAAWLAGRSHALSDAPEIGVWL